MYDLADRIGVAYPSQLKEWEWQREFEEDTRRETLKEWLPREET